ASFQESASGSDKGLNDIFIRKERIWIVGDEGLLVSSTDKGLSFNRMTYDSSRRSSQHRVLDLYSVEFEDSDRGYIVGDEGLILVTYDGGRNWYEQRSGVKEQLFHLSFRNDDGWVVGTKGTILHTSDGGKNWYPQRAGVDVDLNRVYFVS